MAQDSTTHSGCGCGRNSKAVAPASEQAVAHLDGCCGGEAVADEEARESAKMHKADEPSCCSRQTGAQAATARHV